jgi:cell division septum initiation protein DivIVA
MDPLGTIIKIEDALAALRLEVHQLKQENEELKERLEL